MKRFFDSLPLRTKLLVMMFSILILVLASLFWLYWRAERQLISEVQRHTQDLSTAIQFSVEQLTSKGRTNEARLRDYVQRLEKKGVREISIVSNEQEVIASSNPRRIGARLDPNRKDILITARLGEENPGRGSQKTYNLIIPVVVGSQRMGYVLISMVLDDFATLARINFIKRLIVTSLVFGLGIMAALFLSWQYTRPISQVVAAARRVARGHLDETLPVDRRDEIGELNRSFNEMVEQLREREALEARLRQAERLSIVGHLASGIAHEVRNPLNFINLSIDHLRSRFAPREERDREEFERLLGSVKGEVHRLNGMIENFLNYGKPLRLDRKPCEVPILLDEVAEVADGRARDQRIAVFRAYPRALPKVLADGPQLKTCFMNLLVNAFQAMPSGGNLTISARQVNSSSSPLVKGSNGQLGGSPRQIDESTIRPLETVTASRVNWSNSQLVDSSRPVDQLTARPVDTVAASPVKWSNSQLVDSSRPIDQSTARPIDGAGEWVEIAFADTGVGIPEGDLPRVFEPYFTTKEVGIGLGLALTKKVVEEHGGTVALASTPGKGTVAVIRLPLPRPPVPQEPA